MEKERNSKTDLKKKKKIKRLNRYSKKRENVYTY